MSAQRRTMRTVAAFASKSLELELQACGSHLGVGEESGGERCITYSAVAAATTVAAGSASGRIS
jgi:hypothetical protein